MRCRLVGLLLAIVILVGSLASPVEAQSTGAASMRAAPSAGPTMVEPPPGFKEACGRYDWLCRGGSPAASTLDQARILELARSINRRVNRRITQLSDIENYGASDRWTLPRNGSGDCEDIVLLKYSLLLQAGVDGRDLAIAIVLDRNGDNHAVLVLRHESGDLVLDSLTSGIRVWNDTGYRFLAMQNADDQTAWEVVADRPRSSNLLAQR